MDYNIVRDEACAATPTRLTRRDLLHKAGLAAGYLAAVPYASSGRRRSESGSSGEVLEQAEARIEKHRKGRVTLTLVGPNGQPLAPDRDLRITQTGHKFLFGCNIFKLDRCRTPADNAAYEKHFAELLNFATLPFYWWNYERRKGEPEDERTSAIIRWCQGRNITTKGHPLAWNYVDPPWLADVAQEAMELQMKRIGRCVRKFSGGIDIWDVVNEAAHYDREELKQRAPILTGAISEMGVGEYIRAAFRAARQANPQATLLINDYRTDATYPDKVISQLVDDSGKPLYDVIGIQSHMHGGYWGAGRTWEVCERFARFGKPLHFTETTVVSGPRKESTWATTPEGEQRQAQRVAEFYTVLFSHPAVEAITWWDFTDQNAWQRAPAGLVRDDMTPKPAYEKLHGLIKDKWWTRTEGQTDREGRVAFQGFLGRYKVETDLGGRRLSGEFSLDRASQGPIRVQLA
ncbi:MAG: endo-1,4-beta-xylanase [Sedimentisphaerales bacterium]|nr:endo-1,4-beta-xylanase [Sedimentisphaerales bacterium]